MLFFRAWAFPIVNVVSLSSSEALLGVLRILIVVFSNDCGVLLTSWGMVGDLKAPTRFLENCAGRNSIGRPLKGVY